MHHVWSVAWQPARCCARSSRATAAFPSLPQTLGPPARLRHQALPNWCIFSRNVNSSGRQKQSSTASRPFATASRLHFHQTFLFRQQISPRAPSELPFRRTDLRPYEVKVIFGSHAPPQVLANALLKIVHSRRVNGTLDLDLPPKLAHDLKSYPDAFDNALRWLRRDYPIDEDAAILKRIEREEAGLGNEELIARAENLGLYKPQSGVFGKRLGEGGDVYGESELVRLRKANEERAKREEEEVDRYVEQKQNERQEAVEEKAGALTKKREDGLEVSDGSRPPNEYERWKIKYRLRATSDIAFEEAAKAGKIRRLLPSILFAAAVTYGAYTLGNLWSPPDSATRIMPFQSISRATILGIISVNIGVLLLWQWPPAWRILNRYFISTPAVVRPLSHLGNIFSHQTLSHMGFNMLVLWLFGNSLAEQVGRGNFLALYIASGVFGSVASLSSMVLRNVLISSSLGASGAVSGIVAAYCTVNPNNRLTLWLLPPDLAKTLSCDASTALVFLVAIEVLSLTVPFLRGRGIDYVAHLGGYAMGAFGGWLWHREHGSGSGTGNKGEAEGGRWGANRSREQKWYEKLLGR